jgi:signal transduction histidine kinase
MPSHEPSAVSPGASALSRPARLTESLLVGRTRAITPVLRVLLLLGCLALTYLVELPTRDIAWAAALVAAAGISTVAEHVNRFGGVARAVEGLTCAVAVQFTGQNLSPFLPYLIAPVFAGGLRGGTQAAMITAGFEASGLLVGMALPVDGGRTRQFSAVAAQWIVIALLSGLVGAWVRRLEETARRTATATYAAAYRLLSQLYDVMRRLPGSLDPVTTAGGLLDDIAAVTPYDSAAVLVRTRGDRLVPLAHHGEERMEWDVDLRGDNPFADAWASEAPQTCDTRFSRAPDQPVGPWPGSGLVVPLRIHVRMFGLVGLETSRSRAFPVEAITRISDLVNAAALRLETGLLFEEVREIATAEERRRLAREIHDGIAQELASLGYAVDALAANVQTGSHDTLAEDLAGLRQEITRLIRELRLSIFELRSDVDGHGGLGAALSDYLRTIGTSSGLTVHLTMDEATRRLPAETEAELLRIAQEAINNARRHSTADNLWVTCRVHPPHAQLIVEDDGSGLGVGRDDSFGLAIMRERAERLRAKLDIRSREPRGTHVAVTLGSAPASGAGKVSDGDQDPEPAPRQGPPDAAADPRHLTTGKRST